MPTRHKIPDPSRRALLRGRRSSPPWLPWSDPRTVLDACTRCGACVEACPQAVIVRGDGGFPTVDPRLGECSFCAACAQACPAPVFDLSRTPRWPLLAQPGDACLERHGVVCRLCEDSCPNAALRFRPLPGGHSDVGVDPGLCTGCGACVSSCPEDAIRIAPPPREEASPHA